MGCSLTRELKEMRVKNFTISQDCQSKQFKTVLIEHLSILQTKQTNLNHLESNEKLIKLIQISIQKNDVFSNFHINIFQKLSIPFPQQIMQFHMVYDNELKEILKQVKNIEMGNRNDMNQIQLLQQRLKRQKNKTINPQYHLAKRQQKEVQNGINNKYQKKNNNYLQRQAFISFYENKNENKQKWSVQRYGYFSNYQGKKMQQHYKQEIKKLNMIISSMNALNDNKKILLKELQQKITQLTQSKQKNSSISIEIKIMEQKIHTLMYQLERKELSFKSLITQFNLSQQKVKQVHKSNSKLLKQINELQKSNAQLQLSTNELENSNSQLENLNVQIQIKLRLKNNELQQTKKAFQNNFNTSKSMIDNLKKQITQLQNLTDNLNNQLFSTKSELQQLKLYHEDMNKKQKQQFDTLTQEKLSLSNDYQSLQNDYQKLYTQNLQLVKQVDQFQSKNNRLCQQILSLKNKKPQRSFTHYFNGHILGIDTQVDTQWIINTIEKQIKKQIRSTKLIYRMDILNKNNPHDYIDGIPNIFLIAKIQSSQIIVAYSEPAFEKNMGNIKGKLGLIIGLGNRKIFTVKKEKAKYETIEPRPITWDEDYVIWGNNDFRFRMKEKELESDYSKRNCCYQEQGNEKPQVKDLLMTGERKVVLVDFEFYELKFEDKA